MTHICVGKLTIIGSDNGLSPERRQAIIWINAGILLIGPLGTTFSAIYIEILTFSFKKMRSKVSSAKWRPFCFGFNVLITWKPGGAQDSRHTKCKLQLIRRIQNLNNLSFCHSLIRSPMISHVCVLIISMLTLSIILCKKMQLKIVHISLAYFDVNNVKNLWL